MIKNKSKGNGRGEGKNGGALPVLGWVSMDESFKARVDMVFGSLASTRSSSLWSIADHQLQRREWRRSARDDTPCSSSFRQLFVKDRRRTSPSLGSGNVHHQDDQAVWNIRSSIGLDPTLDFEVNIFFQLHLRVAEI